MVYEGRDSVKTTGLECATNIFHLSLSVRYKGILKGFWCMIGMRNSSVATGGGGRSLIAVRKKNRADGSVSPGVF